MKYIDDFKNPKAAQVIEKQIKKLASSILTHERINIMEVCGSHTMAIARYAIRDILPENINLISGPGCPVCVTDSAYIDAAINLARRENIIIATFGDMINVPGSGTGNKDDAKFQRMTLAAIRAEGASVEVCYSPMKALELAKANLDKEVVFLGIGFETTMVPITAVIDIAVTEQIANFSVLTAFKLVPPALEALVADPELNIDAFLCPAHVSAIIGANAYTAFVKQYKIPCVIASFEPLDIMYGIQKILEQLTAGKAFVDNQYKRVVKNKGNIIAQRLLQKYLTPANVAWRGIGIIQNSGLALKNIFSHYDASKRFDIKIKPGIYDPLCRCGDVLKGKIKPSDCAMFAKQCTPLNPIGPCMVSAEGSCAAYYKYREYV